jgi:cytosine/adenosine deaminase-related metal-dependent hydrolase
MVTIDAARALGWDDELGSLEPGKKADVIVVNARQPHLAPTFMAAHRLVYEAVGNDVETVIVDGKIIMEDRQVLTINEADVLEAAQQEAEATIDRAGLQQHMSLPPTFWGHARLVIEQERTI